MQPGPAGNMGQRNENFMFPMFIVKEYTGTILSEFRHQNIYPAIPQGTHGEQGDPKEGGFYPHSNMMGTVYSQSMPVNQQSFPLASNTSQRNATQQSSSPNKKRRSKSRSRSYSSSNSSDSAVSHHRHRKSSKHRDRKKHKHDKHKRKHHHSKRRRYSRSSSEESRRSREDRKKHSNRHRDRSRERDRKSRA